MVLTPTTTTRTVSCRSHMAFLYLNNINNHTNSSNSSHSSSHSNVLDGGNLKAPSM